MSDFSVEALLQFLEWAGDKGLMNKTTARHRRSSCQRIFHVLDDEESQDVRNLDLDHVFARFTNTGGTDLSPNSLRDYKRRMELSVQEFLQYRQDPVNFRPVGRRVARRRRTTGSAVSDSGESARQPVEADASVGESAKPPTLEYPFPLREDVVIHVKGIPTDLTVAEARRFGHFVQTLAIDFRPGDRA